MGREEKSYMVHITERQKKAALLWGKLKLTNAYKRDKSDSNTISFYGVQLGAKSLDNWAKGTHYQLDAVKDLSRGLVSHFNLRNEDDKRIRSNLFNDNISAKMFGNMIGMSVRESQFFIDQLYGPYIHASSLYTFNSSDARRHIQAHGGLYTIYRVDKNHDTTRTTITQIPLSIRSLVATRDGPATLKSKSVKFCIRCKLDILKPESDQAYAYEYDGYAAPCSDDIWNWHFERRREVDGLYITTSGIQQNAMGQDYFEGDMISTARSKNKPAHWKIVIVKDSSYKITSRNARKAFGLYDLQEKGKLEQQPAPDIEKEFFNRTRKIIHYSEFQDIWVLKKLFMD